MSFTVRFHNIGGPDVLRWEQVAVPEPDRKEARVRHVAKGSLFLTRPSVFDYMAERSDLLAASTEMFQLVKTGVLSSSIHHRFPLAAAADAHRLLEARQRPVPSSLRRPERRRYVDAVCSS